MPQTHNKHVYLNGKTYNGVQLVARLEGISIKMAAEQLIPAGLSKYMGEKLTEQVTVYFGSEDIAINLMSSIGSWD